jgi:hypothetical protein
MSPSALAVRSATFTTLRLMPARSAIASMVNVQEPCLTIGDSVDGQRAGAMLDDFAGDDLDDGDLALGELGAQFWGNMYRSSEVAAALDAGMYRAADGVHGRHLRVSWRRNALPLGPEIGHPLAPHPQGLGRS